MSDGLNERIRGISERLGEVLGEPVCGEIRRLSSGASRETCAFATASGRDLVLQMDRSAPSEGAGRPAQAPLLAAAGRAGVPVPPVVAHGYEDRFLGPSWIVVEAIAGTTDPRKILAGDGVAGAPELIDSIASALAGVHRMACDPSLAPPVEDSLALLRESYDHLGEPHPTFELAFRALASGRPPARRTLVHGDFRIGNLMVGEDGVTGVLDWELAHLGDPLEDLGWLCVPAWRFQRPDRPAAGLGTREQLAAAYEAHSGMAVDMAALRWWELAGTLRWGVICVMQAFTHLSGATRSIEHAVIGRRACEVEWDLLGMLDPRAASASLPDAGSAASQSPSRAPLHDRPTAIELLDAARGALGDDLLPSLDGRAAFQVRVTMRALGMVRRELIHSEEHAALHAGALARLGVADERGLAAAIRSGSLDGRQAELLVVLRAVVRAKLQAANPRYLDENSASAKEGP